MEFPEYGVWQEFLNVEPKVFRIDLQEGKLNLIYVATFQIREQADDYCSIYRGRALQ